MYQDLAISNWILENISQKSEFIGQIAKILSNINSWGQMWLIIMIALMVYEYIKTKKINFYYLITIIPILIGWCLSDFGIKEWVGRPRPYQEIEGFKTYMDTINYKYPIGNSFPSGHTLIAFASAFVLSNKNKKYIPYAYVLATLIAMSRLILGAHYLSDVIAGMGLGTLLGGLGVLLTNFLSPKINSFVNDKLSKKHETR